MAWIGIAVAAGCSGGDTSPSVAPPVVNTNSAPIAQDDQVQLKSASDANAIDVLANDSDADGDELMVGIESVSIGSATVNEDNTIEFSSEADGFVGNVVIEYVIHDGNATANATLEITITGFNARVNWLPPAQTENGSNLDPSDITGFEIGYRRLGSSQFTYVEIASADETTHSLIGIPGGTYEVRMATRDSKGALGRFSEPVVSQVGY